MKYRLIIYIGCVILGSCSSYSQQGPKEYFVRPCEFVCDYPFNDTTKWVITCRAWGLLKYYHPNITAGQLDWDETLLNILDNISHTSTPKAFNAELKKMLAAAGKYVYKKDDKWDNSLNMNVDLCWIDNSFLDETLRDELKKIASLSVKYPSYYSVDYESAGHLMEREKTDGFDVDTSYKYRLLALFRYWNVIYYFSPHKYLMDKSWDKTLFESVFPFLNATDEQSYKTAFLKLAASLNDGHGYITIEKGYSNESQNLIEKIEGKTVVKIDGGGLNKGDIIDGIGGRDINYIRDSLSALISASTQGNKEYRINCYVAEMIFFNITEVAVSREGQKLTIHTFPIPFDRKYPSSYKRLSNNIGYVDLSLLTTEKIDGVFQSFSDTKGIIFDLRQMTGPGEYDRGVFYSYLSGQKNIRFSPMVLWDLEHPGAYFLLKNTQDVIPGNIKSTPYTGKIVFLINESTQSSTETVALTARINFHASLIGRPTSGALGRVVWIPISLNNNAAFSGTALLSLDETELQRKGITPDIEVYPTMESVKAGKDEILEAAIEYLNKI